MSTGLAKYFEDFVEKLLARSGITMSRNKDGGFDFLAISEKGTSAAIELKLYSSGSVSPALLQSAAAAVAYAAQKHNLSKSILVTNVIVPTGLQLELLNSLGVIIYDYAVLSGLASSYLDLAQEWESLVGLTRVFRFDSGPESKPTGAPIDPIRAFDAPLPLSFSVATQLPPPSTKGAHIATEIEKIPTGKSGAGAFEKKCTEALKYIFAEDLAAWHMQEMSDTSMNRYDLIARISSDEDFWRCLVRDFRARYVIFEFKNYTEQITQKEIYTTEKYLYPAAMRAAAIVISRQGADENALSAARGALRESGKLIINLTIADVRSMLESRDRGESGADVLVEHLDRMLMRIER